MNWTAISELPDRDGSYLVWAPESFPKNTQCVVAEFYSDNGKFYSEGGSVMPDVTHWMNLPDSPKQGEPKVGEVSTTVTGYFHREGMNKLLNLHWLGSESANYVADDNHTILRKDHPDIEKLVAAQYRLSHGFSASVVVDLYADGTTSNPRILTTPEVPKRVVLD